MKALIIVSFGTASLEGIEVLENFEEDVKKELQGKYNVFKAFTSSSMSNILFNKHGKLVQRLEEILYKLNNEKYKEIYIQPLHIIEGSEYSHINKVLKEYSYTFSKIRIGNVLMGENEEKFLKGSNVIYEAINKNFKSKDSNIILVGHGSKNTNDYKYKKIKEKFIEEGFKNTYIGTLEGENQKEEILNKMLEDKIREVYLVPILMLPGKHILKDIFGDYDSWKTLLEDNNIKVNYIKKSLLQYDDIKMYYINNILNNLK